MLMPSIPTVIQTHDSWVDLILELNNIFNLVDKEGKLEGDLY